MPTLQSMQLPMPSNWQDFETIVRDAMGQLWSSPNLQKNGRPGQKQDGVDIYGPDQLGRPVGIQCKRYKMALSLKTIDAEIGNAEKFKGQLTALFMATTADHDSTLQQQLRALSEERATRGKFVVSILFWEDIIKGLVLNPAVFRAHYPDIALPSSARANNTRCVAAFELGYYGADLLEFVKLIYSEYGWLANADPDELTAKLRVLELHSQNLLAPTDASPIVECLTKLQDALSRESPQRDNWGSIERYAKRASNRIVNAASLLAIEEGNCLDVGVELGRIYHHVDGLPAKPIRERIESKVRSILGEASVPAITDTFRRAKSVSDGFRWAMRIYGLINRELRYAR